MPYGKCQGHGWWQGKFRGCGYRITAAREAVLNTLMLSEEKHMSAEEIYLSVHENNPAVGLTTIYRTLEILNDMGMVFKFDFGDGRARYELASGTDDENHHHHLVCTACKKIIDYKEFIDDELELLRKTEKGLSEKYNFTINTHLIQFYGLCEDCRDTR
ncbi:MAG: transcriptional repressor [Candidatus Auribacterota bacterium]|jgi:Fur family ferric uptake transcriptional regulator|uniref:Transcriptional repressor n=1 Tax=Candidatus Auribacter fodinae TaxID=2093366 RepID=A0A3A4R123_9BACT|nr:MAG: transcriptional repressor [Candidatus Auribacter fodinae]